MTFFTRFRPVVLTFLIFSVAGAWTRAASEWISLFDGNSLRGWRAAENPASFEIVDHAIVCDGPRAHLFYVGTGEDEASFRDFELEFEAMTKPGANSGVFFHTTWQEKSWPAQGFEVQVNNSQKQHGDYHEMKKTGSLYAVRNTYKAPADDNVWFTVNVKVQIPRVQIRVNGVLVVDYIEGATPLPEGMPDLNRLGSGTFALQAHDPDSIVHYRNLRVRHIDPAPEQIKRISYSGTDAQLHRLAKDNFPLVDLHTHLKGNLTLEKALEISRHTGINLGIATNGGQGFPIQNDSAALAFLDTMKGQPVFLGLQAEGREWMKMFSKETRAEFDYIFSDSMTYTNAAGKRMRLWIPAEVEIGPDVEAFMDYLVDQTVQIIESEPIDIYVNPTFLPEAISSRSDELWTDARMKRVIDAAVKHGVAIEINTRYRIPSEKFLRLAKATGAKFTIGTNNTSADDFGDWTYALQMQEKLELGWKDMFVPGHAPSRAKREMNR